MPCICHGAVTGDEMMDKIIKTKEYKQANKLLKEAADIIHMIPIDMECYPSSFFDSWCTAFKHHLRGCSERR